MQIMERLAFLLLFWILQFVIFQIQDQKTWSDISLLLTFRKKWAPFERMQTPFSLIK